METTKRNGAARHERRLGTVAELLEEERARALAGLGRSVQGLGTEISEALGRSPMARHPLLAGGASLLLALVSAPAILRAVGPVMAVLGSASERALTLASLALPRRRLW